MNTKSLFMAATIAALGLTACTNDDEGNIPATGEVKIVTSIKGNGPTPRAAIDPATGAGSLENGDKILLVVSTIPIGGSYNTRLLKDYTIGSSKLYWDNFILGDFSGTQWAGESSVSLGEPPYNFAAYYPNITPAQAILDGFNVATATNPDLLGAKAEGVAKSGTVDLVFSHLMHKLVVNLSSNVYTESELGSAVVSLENLYSKVEFNNRLTDGTTFYAFSGTDAYPSKQGASTSFIVAPQNLPAAGTGLIEIVVDGKAFTYKVPTGLTQLERGKVLTLNLAITRDAVTLQSNTIQPWGDQDTINGDIEEQP
jgi:hypothetical protein